MRIIINEIPTVITINSNKKRITAVIIDDNGTVVKGHALCDPTDTFDLEFGTELAISRAIQRYSARKVRILIRESEQRGK